MPIFMEFTTVHSSEATNTSGPSYRKPSRSFLSSSFPPLRIWESPLKPKSDHCSHLLKTLQWHPLPSRRTWTASAWPQWADQPLSLSPLWALACSTFFEVLTLLWAFPCAASSSTTSKSSTNSVLLPFHSLTLNLILGRPFLTPNLVRSCNTLDLITTRWDWDFFLMSVSASRLRAS